MIYIEGVKSTPKTVSDLVCVQEESSYMRDYVYREGVLAELHFDKVQNKQNFIIYAVKTMYYIIRTVVLRKVYTRHRKI